MPSTDLAARLGVVIGALFFAALAIWVCAMRSTIPRSLVGTVAEKRVLQEHSEDVHMISLESGASFHVDPVVYGVADEGEAIQKGAWARTLSISGERVTLEWSRDARRMAVVMPAMFLLIAVTVAFARHND